MRAYAVNVGLPGYLPNSSSVFETLWEARECAKEEKEQFIESGRQVRLPHEDEDTQSGDVKVIGDIRKDWAYDVYQYGSYGWHLWQRITIEEIEISEDEFAAIQEHGW